MKMVNILQLIFDIIFGSDTTYWEMQQALEQREQTNILKQMEERNG